MEPQFFTRSPEQFGGKIPFVVSDLINRLREMEGQKAEGIFRMSGAASGIAGLCSELDNGRVADWSVYSNVHTVACALKKYFRDMVVADPLIPAVFYNDMLAIPKTTDQDAQVEAYKKIVAQLSPARRLTLAFVFRFLHEVMQSETSKMNANNLAIVFSPNVLSPIGGPTVEHTLKNNLDQNKTVASLVTLTDRVFADVEIGENCFVSDDEIEALKPPPLAKDDIDRFMELREIRKRSMIPFVPYDLLKDPNFRRPTRAVSFEE